MILSKMQRRAVFRFRFGIEDYRKIRCIEIITKLESRKDPTSTLNVFSVR